MQPTNRIDRVVLVVMDGLRADAVTRSNLPTLTDLAGSGAATFAAQTVRPSVTASAMTSLFSGVPPEIHGISGQGFGIPKRPRSLQPLPRLLSRNSLPVSFTLRQIPLRYHWLSSRLASHAGVTRVQFGGNRSWEILELAERDLVDQRTGLIVMHWPDGDDAGHADGWHSHAYTNAVRGMDGALASLRDLLRITCVDETLLIVCSDHGGGGAHPTDHDSDHPDDTTIPLILSGSSVAPTVLAPGVTLLDVPATILWALGLNIPTNYFGRPLREGFRLGAAAA